MDLSFFKKEDFYTSFNQFFSHLSIPIHNKTHQLFAPNDILGNSYKPNLPSHNLINLVYFLGTVDESIFHNSLYQSDISNPDALKKKKDYDGLYIIGVTLKLQNGQLPSRTALAEITRAFNKEFNYGAVVVLFYYDGYLSLSNCERMAYKQTWREGEKLGKVSILRDIKINNPHRGHLQILENLQIKSDVKSYETLYNQWRQVFDVQILNKNFYNELFNWFFWAVENVSFPNDVVDDKDDKVFNQESIIRLLTRIIFIWFMKEKKLIPEMLFNENEIANIINGFNRKKSNVYYRAILQNLFFATLNQNINERKFAPDGTILENKNQYGIKTYYRYANDFLITENEVLNIFKSVPFINGGLFDCLDYFDKNNKVIYLDGFSRNPKKQASVPDELFFAKDKEIDIGKYLDPEGKKQKIVKTKGLIHILDSYKFTIAENTPIEEEVALDPELLGKVFENLLASYNPETKTTARKATGSFYTPREIVNYMVDESLIAYLTQNLSNNDSEQESKIRHLISYTDEPHKLGKEEVNSLLDAIEKVKILDPACGSGAFPMGVLHKLVHILHKLDPKNEIWKQKLIDRTPSEIRDETRNALANKSLDYVRKLGLIENCIYGVDIQTIAIQISKLRFFISLLVEQHIDKSKENYDIKSLPNLETKFVAANTLIGLEKPEEGTIHYESPEVKNAKENLILIRKDLFYTNSFREKKSLQEKEKKARIALQEALKKDHYATNTAQAIASWDPYDQSLTEKWFDPLWMFGIKDGFNIVIGNPPYVNIENIPKKDREYYLRAYGENGSLGKRYDLYQIFILKGIKLLSNITILSFILPNTFLVGHSYLTLRKNLASKTSILQVVDLPQNIFESATVDNVLLFIKLPLITDNSIYIHKLFTNTSINKIKNKDWDDSFSIMQSDLNVVNQFRINVHSNPAKKEIYKKYFKEAELLGSITESSQGIIIYKTKEDAQKSQYTSFQFQNGWKKLLRGTNIGLYQIKWNGEYIKYGDWLWSKREEKYFKNPKILLQAIRNKSLNRRLVATFDDEQYYNAHNLANIISKENSGYDLKYILAILNSNLINLWYKDHFPNVNINPNDFREIPIKKLPFNQQEEFIKLVDKILQIKSVDRDSNTTLFEKQIDKLVYKIYELTDEEIAIVEGKE